MSVIINPGSGPVVGGEGWTNSYEGARRWADKWLTNIRRDCSPDVELVDGPPEPDGEGRWRFHFRHTVTGVTVPLDTHGIDNLDAYVKERIFHPRVYWKECSLSEPELNQWAADGFVPSFRPVDPS